MVLDQPWMYVVLIGLLLIVYASLLPRTAGGKRQRETAASEMAEAMDVLAAELEEQHRDIAQMVSEMRKEHQERIRELASRLEESERQRLRDKERLDELSLALERVAAVAASKEASGRPVVGAAEQTQEASGQPAAVAAEQMRAVPVHGPEKPPVRDSRVPDVQYPGAGEEAPAEPQADADRASGSGSLRRRYSELFLLHDQGKSVDAIARKLGMNNGEVSLIIQLAKREGEAHA